MEFKKETRGNQSRIHKIYTKFIFAKNRKWWIEIFHRPLSITLEIIPSIYLPIFTQTFSPTAPGVPSKIRSRKHVTNAQFSFDLISGEEIIGCIPPRIFYSRRGKKGGFKVARVAISGTLDQGGVVIRLGEGNGGGRGVGTRFGGGRYQRPSKRHRESLHNQIFKSAQIAFWFSIDPRFYHRASRFVRFSFFFYLQ